MRIGRMHKYPVLFVLILLLGCYDDQSDTEQYQKVAVTFTYTATTVRIDTNTIPLTNVRMFGSFNGWKPDDPSSRFTRSNGMFVLTRHFLKGYPIQYKLIVNQPDGTEKHIYDMRPEGPHLTPAPDYYKPDGYGGTIAVWTNR